MNTIKLFSLLTLLSLISTINEVNETYTKSSEYKSYYYAYAVDYNTNKLYVTQILYKEYNIGCTFTDSAISNQFRDYLKAEYSGNFIECKGSAFSIYSDNNKEHTKAKATGYLRNTMKLYDKIIRVRDFDFLCE